MTTTEDRAIVALIRYAFPRASITYCERKAKEIAKGDAEVEELLVTVMSFLSATS
jgi:hypothetical protein